MILGITADAMIVGAVAFTNARQKRMNLQKHRELCLLTRYDRLSAK